MMISFGSFHISVMLADNRFFRTCHLIAPSEDDVSTLQRIYANVVCRLRLKRGVCLFRDSF
jgi:hypothetical protein